MTLTIYLCIVIIPFTIGLGLAILSIVEESKRKET